jgi:predicted O-linked N-acetylglucosamine transferase (SPINDLY family)
LTTAAAHAAVAARAGRPAAAATILSEAIATDGATPALLGALAGCEALAGRQAAAVATARRAAALAPDRPEGWRALLGVLPYADETRAVDIAHVARRLGATVPRSTATFAPRRAGERLRVGLLSDTLGAHPAGWLSIAALEALDPARFDIVCFGARRLRDPIADRFTRLASAWHELAGLDDAQAAPAIRAQRIDVLIDMGGWGDHGRIAVCAHRAAPVQIKWVGNLTHPTGLAEIDYLVGDTDEIPPRERAHYTERLLLMPDGYFCYQPPGDAPDVSPPPCLARGHVTFGCFGNLAKVTPRTIATWSDILSQVPRARLMLTSPALDEAETAGRIAASFAAHGIAPGRIALRGFAPHRALLAQYADVDIALDPMPYTGCLMTCEALWTGVPTVSRAGEGFHARHGASILARAGLSDWVVHTRAGYVARALRAAREWRSLAPLRARLRAQVAASALCDAPRFAAAFGAALTRCADAAPRTGARPP